MKRLTLVVAILCGLATNAQAGLVVATYSGHIRNIAFFNGATDSLGFSVGGAVSGSFILDLDISDQDPNPLRAVFVDSIRQMTFGSFSQLPSEIAHSAANIDANPLHDHFSTNLNALRANESDQFSFSLDEPSAIAVLGNDSVDLTTLNLANFLASDSHFSFMHSVYQADGRVETVLVDARVEDLQIRPVPEPSTMVLLGSGAVVALGYGLKRRRCRFSIIF